MFNNLRIASCKDMGAVIGCRGAGCHSPSEDENSCSTCRSAYAPHAGNRVRRLGLPIAQVPLDDLRSAAKKFVFVDLIDPFQNIHRLIDKF